METCLHGPTTSAKAPLYNARPRSMSQGWRTGIRLLCAGEEAHGREQICQQPALVHIGVFSKCLGTLGDSTDGMYDGERAPNARSM